VTDYPRMFDLEPITEWPGALAERREPGPFKATLATTMRELSREVDALKGENVRLAIAVTRDQMRLDGRLKAGKVAWHPGIILMFDTPQGTMRYANDKWTRWEHNLRGITKELEALRGIERWVSNHGEQYGGFLAIESAFAMPAAPFSTAATAETWLLELTRSYKGTPLAKVIREAHRITHPDLGGDSDQADLVNKAEALIRQAGML